MIILLYVNDRTNLCTGQTGGVSASTASLLSLCGGCRWLWMHSSIICLNPCARSAHGFKQKMLECIRGQQQPSHRLSRPAQHFCPNAYQKCKEVSMRMRAGFISSVVLHERGANDTSSFLRTTSVSAQGGASSPVRGASISPPSAIAIAIVQMPIRNAGR